MLIEVSAETRVRVRANTLLHEWLRGAVLAPDEFSLADLRAAWDRAKREAVREWAVDHTAESFPHNG